MFFCQGGISRNEGVVVFVRQNTCLSCSRAHDHQVFVYLNISPISSTDLIRLDTLSPCCLAQWDFFSKAIYYADWFDKFEIRQCFLVDSTEVEFLHNKKWKMFTTKNGKLSRMVKRKKERKKERKTEPSWLFFLTCVQGPTRIQTTQHLYIKTTAPSCGRQMRLMTLHWELQMKFLE